MYVILLVSKKFSQTANSMIDDKKYLTYSNRESALRAYRILKARYPLSEVHLLTEEGTNG